MREPRLSDEQKRKRMKFANWVRNNFTKAETLRFVFSDEKLFTVNGVYNRQNERIWAVSRAEADKNGKNDQETTNQLATKKIRPQVLLDTCADFYSRIRRLSRSDGSYLR